MCPESRLLQGRGRACAPPPLNGYFLILLIGVLAPKLFDSGCRAKRDGACRRKRGGRQRARATLRQVCFLAGRNVAAAMSRRFFVFWLAGSGVGIPPIEKLSGNPRSHPGPADVSVARDTLQHVWISCGETAAAVIYGFWMQPVSSPSSKDDAHLPYARCYLRTFATYLPPKKKHTQTCQTHKARGRDPCRRPPTRPVCTPFHRLRPFADRSSR